MSASSPAKVLRTRAERYLTKHFGAPTAEPLDLRRVRRRQYQRDWERRQREAAGIKPAAPAECGTRSGYNSHLADRVFGGAILQVALERGIDLDEVTKLDDFPPMDGPCDACLKANAFYQRQRRAEDRAWQLANNYVNTVLSDPEAAQRIYEDIVAHAKKADSDKGWKAVAFAEGAASG